MLKPQPAGGTAMLQKRNSPEAARAKPAAFVWEDPFLLDEQLSEEERMVRDAARDYAQDRLALAGADGQPQRDLRPRDHVGDGRARPARADHPRGVRRRRGVLRRLRADRPRGRAGRFGLPLGDERAVEPGHAPDLRLRHRRAAQEVPAEARQRRVGRLLRADRARPRLRPGVDDHPGEAGRRRLQRSPARRTGSPTRRSPTSSWSGPSPTPTAARSRASCSTRG